MHFQLFNSFDQLESLAEEWNDLLGCCSASHVPFLRYEYLSAWWKTLGGGEWASGELCVVVARHSDGELAGIAPLFFSHNRNDEPAVMLLGSIEISDYLDLIVRMADIQNFVAGLLNFLDSTDLPAWKVLDWYNIPEDSPTLAALNTTAGQRGWSFDQERLQPCPYIALPGDWETYLSGIDKKQRHEIRRKMRRAEEHPTPVRWYIVQQATHLTDEIEAFLTLMAQDEEKERFLTPVMRRQILSIGQAAFKAGWLQLAFLEVGGEKIAGYMNFDFNGHIWVYNSGLNFNFRELSPGWVLLGYLLQWANEHQRRWFDFMRGNEEYKYRFGAQDRFIERAIMRR